MVTINVALTTAIAVMIDVTIAETVAVVNTGAVTAAHRLGPVPREPVP